MLKEWQFNILFFVGVGGAIILLLGPDLGLELTRNPTAVTGVGAILTYILTQKKALTKTEDKKGLLPTKKGLLPTKKKEEDNGT